MKIYIYHVIDTKGNKETRPSIHEGLDGNGYYLAAELEVDESTFKPLPNEKVISDLEKAKADIKAEFSKKIAEIDNAIKNLLALPGAA